MSNNWRNRGTQGQYNPGGGGGTPPPSSVQQTGNVALVAGTQSYAIVFSPAFGAAPGFIGGSVLMPTSSGETFEVAFDLSTLTASGVTAWLSGIPTAASDGGSINWIAAL
jgi:hypothetical protein